MYLFIFKILELHFDRVEFSVLPFSLFVQLGTAFPPFAFTVFLILINADIVLKQIEYILVKIVKIVHFLYFSIPMLIAIIL